MSPRAWSIFRLLMKDPFGVTTVRQLALNLDVSERTIRYDLDALSDFLGAYGIALQRVPHKGISISPDDVAAALDLIQDGREGGREYLSAEEREQAIAWMLLDGTCPRSLAGIADGLEVSRSTAKRDFDRAAAWLSQHGTAVRYDAQAGWHIEADEYTIRKAMVDFVESLPDSSSDSISGGNAAEGRFPPQAILDESDLETASARLAALCALHGERLTDGSFQMLACYLCIAISRTRGCHFVDDGASEGLASGWHGDICTMLSDLMPGLPPSHVDAEAMVLDALIMAASRQSLSLAASDMPDWASRITEDFLGCISRSLGFDLFSDKELVQAMTIHAKAMVARIKLGIAARNPMLDQIKTQFSGLYQECASALSDILTPYSLTASDDEVGYFATYVGATLERLKKQPAVNRKTRVAVVCGAGIGTASFLFRALMNEYPHMEVVALLSARDCQSFDYAGVDLVLSTVDIPSALPRPVLRVSPMLTRSDVRLIDAFLNPVSAVCTELSVGEILELVEKTCDIRDRAALEQGLAALLEPKAPCTLPEPEGFMTLVQLMERGEIQTGVSAKSWEDAVWMAARPLLDDGRMTERYIQQVFKMAKRYEQHGVILAPLCAPHAEPDASNKASISVVTTSDDVVVSMGGDEVRLNVIMLLCLQTPVAHAVALDELFSLADEYPHFISDLHDVRTPAEALGVTKRYLKLLLRQMPAGSTTGI
jgi:mannitol operon transcriptional antiterminator